MGCWNGTCMISHLPIIAGEKIKLVLVYSRFEKGIVLNKSAYVYPNEILTPAFLAISGEYNDYGNIENIQKDWNYDIITSVLKNIFGEELKVDGEVKKDWALEDVLEGIERGGLEYYDTPSEEIKEMLSYTINLKKGVMGTDREHNLDTHIASLEEKQIPKWRKADLSFVMIRQDIWDSVCSIYKDLPVYDRESKDYKEIPFSELLQKTFSNTIDAHASLIQQTQSIKRDIEINDKLHEFNDVFNAPGCGSGKLWGVKSYSKYMLNSPKEAKESVFKLWSEQTYLDACLSATRRGWMIQCGAGSQSDCWEDYIKLSEKIIEICKSKINEQN